MKWFLIGVGALHALFMVLEVFPWRSPVLLRIVSKKRLKDQPFTNDQRELVATIVHNAGIYNAILAGGLLWAAVSDPPNRDVARVLLAGAAVAGAFGTATLKSPFTALQALLGIVGLIRL
jgi:uncharacterized membrane protein